FDAIHRWIAVRIAGVSHRHGAAADVAEGARRAFVDQHLPRAHLQRQKRIVLRTLALRAEWIAGGPAEAERLLLHEALQAAGAGHLGCRAIARTDAAARGVERRAITVDAVVDAGELVAARIERAHARAARLHGAGRLALQHAAALRIRER